MLRASCNELNKICRVADLGLTNVPRAEDLMNGMSKLRADNKTDDALIFTTHPKTVSLGLKDRGRSAPKDLLVPTEVLEEEGIQLTRSVRGGGITFHWPGQLACYPIIQLRDHERDIPAYMSKLEEVGILTFRRFNIEAQRKRDTAAHVGLWLDDRKIMSMGVRVGRWVTSFGFAINVQGDISQARYVRPCGISGARLTTMEEALGFAPSRISIVNAVTDNFAKVFDRTIDSSSCPVFRHFSFSWGSPFQNS